MCKMLRIVPGTKEIIKIYCHCYYYHLIEE